MISNEIGKKIYVFGKTKSNLKLVKNPYSKRSGAERQFRNPVLTTTTRTTRRLSPGLFPSIMNFHVLDSSIAVCVSLNSEILTQGLWGGHTNALFLWSVAASQGQRLKRLNFSLWVIVSGSEIRASSTPHLLNWITIQSKWKEKKEK